MFGLALLGASTLAFATARSLVILVIARCLQGLASSIPSTVGVALLYDKVGQEHIGEALGWTAFSITIAFFIGPLIGGLLYQYLGYHAVFIPVYALVVIEIGLRALIIEERDIGERSNGKAPLVDPERDELIRGYGAIKTLDNTHPCNDTPIVAERSGSPTAPHPVFMLLAERRMLLSMIGLMLLSSVNGVFESVVSIPLFI
jgi:MFS family permease